MALSLQEVMKSERLRLHAERKAIVAQQRELEMKLAEIDLERAAIAAYEIARSGKLKQLKKPMASRAAMKRPASNRMRPDDTKRNTIVRAIMGNPSGRSLFEKTGWRGDVGVERT
jgi:hypothetical protein